MGVNIYAKLGHTNVDFYWNQIKKSTKERNLENLKDVIESFEQEENKNTIHIGKCSYGWKFLFNHNNWKYYDYTRESINRFLCTCESLEDEYGDKISVDEFWKNYVDSHASGFNGEMYHLYECEQAFKKMNGEIEDKLNFYPSYQNACASYETAKQHNFYEEDFYRYDGKCIKIPNNLSYRFSQHTEFF